MLNKDFFILFVLAHFIGDYVLQTNKIAKMKSENIKGVAIHSLLVCLSQLVLLSFFGARGIIAAFTGAGIHFLIDSLKLILNKKVKITELFLYLLDQGLHFLVILLLTLAFAPSKSISGAYIFYAGLLIELILIVFVSTVTVKTVVRSFFKNLIKRSYFEKYERWADALTGGLLYASYLIYPLLMVLLLIPCGYVYCKRQQAGYQYSRQVSLVKFTTLVLFVVLAAVINGVI